MKHFCFGTPFGKGTSTATKEDIATLSKEIGSLREAMIKSIGDLQLQVEKGKVTMLYWFIGLSGLGGIASVANLIASLKNAK